MSARMPVIAMVCIEMAGGSGRPASGLGVSAGDGIVLSFSSLCGLEIWSLERSCSCEVWVFGECRCEDGVYLWEPGRRSADVMSGGDRRKSSF